MYSNEGFTKIDTVPRGVFNYVIPGVSIDLTYKGGETRINRTGTVVMAELSLEQVTVRPHSIGRLTTNALERIEDSEDINALVHLALGGASLLFSCTADDHFAKLERAVNRGDARLSLYGSHTRDGNKLLTMPAPYGIIGSDNVRGYELEKMIDKETAYGLHAAHIGSNALRTRTEYGQADARGLITRAQAEMKKVAATVGMK